jgi:hypothetical protein
MRRLTIKKKIDAKVDGGNSVKPKLLPEGDVITRQHNKRTKISINTASFNAAERLADATTPENVRKPKNKRISFWPKIWERVSEFLDSVKAEDHNKVSFSTEFYNMFSKLLIKDEAASSNPRNSMPASNVSRKRP